MARKVVAVTGTTVDRPRTASDELELFEDALPKSLHEVHAKDGKTKQVSVPVHLSIMVKSLESDPNHASLVRLRGTLLQRVYFYNLAEHREPGKQDQQEAHGFEIRINDGNSVGPESLSFRKAKKEWFEYKGESRLRTDLTFSFVLPMQRHTVFTETPFNLAALSLQWELTSFVSTKGAFEFRPDLYCHTKDLRRLVSVRDWKNMDMLDRMRKLDLLHPSPTIEYGIEIKDGSGQLKAIYTPKVTVTFYASKFPIQDVLQMFFPILFAVVASTTNALLVHDDVGDFVANHITIGLSIVLLMPTISAPPGTYTNSLSVDHFLVSIVFLGLIIGFFVSPFWWPEGVFTFPRTNPMFWVSTALLCSALFIPIVSWMRFARYVRTIKSFDFNPGGDGPWTCKGKPKGDVVFEDLCPFWEKGGDGNGSEATINRRLDPERMTEADGAKVWKYVMSKKGLIVPKLVFLGLRVADVKHDSQSAEQKASAKNLRIGGP